MANTAQKLRKEALLRQLRVDIGCSRLYAPEFVRLRCESIYGREISGRNWLYWLRSVDAQADEAWGDLMSEATYILLVTRAALLKGNQARKGSPKSRVEIERLDETVRAVISGDRPWDVPNVISYSDLKRLIELRALKTYTDRHLRRCGLKRSQQLYSQTQAMQILEQFPDYSYVFQQTDSAQQSTAGRCIAAATAAA